MTTEAAGGPVLALRDLHKSFGATAIIRGVNLEVTRGQRHGLIGPNGAGKSTLFNLISGHYVPSAGEINGWVCICMFPGATVGTNVGQACPAC